MRDESEEYISPRTACEFAESTRVGVCMCVCADFNELKRLISSDSQNDLEAAYLVEELVV